MIPCIPFHRDTRIFCVVEEYLPLGMFHTANLMLGFGHYETMAVHFYFFLAKKFNFHSSNSKDTTKISKPSHLYRGREIFREKNNSIIKLRIQFDKRVSYHIDLVFNPTKTTKTKLQLRL